MGGEKGNPRSEKVKVGNVTLTIFPNPRPDRGGKIYWKAIYRDENNKRRYIKRASKEAIKEAAKRKAREISSQTVDLSLLSREKQLLVRAFLDLDPDWSTIEKLRNEQVANETSVSDAFDQFIEVKRANAGDSPHNVNILRNRIGNMIPKIKNKPIASVTVQELDKLLTKGTWQASTRKAIRASMVTFFRWCRVQGMLPDRTTEAEKMAKPIVIRKAPSTYSPEELRTMLANVSEEFLPWLAISSWAGIRREELYPNRKSKKDALAWEDIDFERKLITIRREVSKTNERRVIPLCDALAAILAPLVRSGRITGSKTPTDSKNGIKSETRRLGELVGGWRQNALRHSFVSYRCALVGVGKAAMEAGNSEAETRRSYRDAKSEEEAREWFASPLRPRKSGK